MHLLSIYEFVLTHNIYLLLLWSALFNSGLFAHAHAMLGITKRSKTTILIGMLLIVLHPCSQEVKEDREGRVERLLGQGVEGLSSDQASP